MAAGLGEKMLEAGGKLLPRELKSRMKNNEKDEQDATTGIEVLLKHVLRLIFKV